ncbi:MAG: hypothetical protein JW753_00990 [Dehalococcoidia bacterium]|nr:hypothetical protein [Dehalococcoidia bacterium]
MADGWLLKGVEDLVNKIKLLESEKREAVAKIEVLERENCELAALIAQASAIVAEALKEGAAGDTLPPQAVNAPAMSVEPGHVGILS